MTRKQFFDKLRKAVPGIWNRPGAIAEGNELYDAMESSRVPDAPSIPELPGNPERIAAAGIALIKRFEGCHKKLPDGRVQAYPDPGTGNLPITIGWGTTRGVDNRPIPRDAIMTQAEVDKLFERDLQRYADDVAKCLGSAPTSQDQFDALVSFHYNTGAITTATLTRKHKAGDFAGAAKEFARWNRAGGRVLAGLTRRRAAEAALYGRGS